MKDIDSLSIATIRSMCIDMINKAKSGHPGMALGAAPALYTLYTRHLVSNPKEPNWINRDRFVLSAGHGSALLYTILHLCGYQITLEDLKNLRQLGAITTGHPEFGVTPGVDATTGPLGQGIAQAVGLAIAERAMPTLFIEGDKLIDHYTYALCGDGCLQEGISQEAISLAGFQKLNKLILLYDANEVTLDGRLDFAYNEDVKKRFEAVNWNVLEVKDGNDVDAIDEAIKQAKKSKEKPTLIIIHTIIGFGSKNQGTNKVHGAPLGEEDGNYAKKESYGFDHEPFYVPQEVYEHFNKTFTQRGEKAYDKYQDYLTKWAKSYKSEYARYNDLLSGDLSRYIPDTFPEINEEEVIATRKASNNLLQSLLLKIPNLYGGSADVASSVMTKVNNVEFFTPECRQGHQINYGIRELAMTAISNGMLCHGGLRTFVGSFFSFSDYMKPAIRIAALSNLPNIFVFSHDSIAVGEDGPTHQPVEQLAMLRCIPNLINIRPADTRETYAAWKIALNNKNGPTSLILSRQALPVLNTSFEGVKHGAYVVSEAKNPDYEIIASGSELSLALQVKENLKDELSIRVISMPSWELFEQQDDEYKKSLFLLSRDKRISLEMLSTMGWEKYADHNYGVNKFGKSAPLKVIVKAYGFSVEAVSEYIKGLK